MGNKVKMKKTLKLEHIQKSFGSNVVLKDISIELYGGEVLGLVGVNGAGKSTLMNIISGEVLRDSGRMLLNGKNLTINSPLSAEEHGIALIHQEPVDFSEMSVAQNIFISNMRKSIFKPFISNKKMRGKSGELLTGLGSTLDPAKKLKELSMGERQLVAVARALAQDADVILFDEPTSSLSIKEKRKLFELIKKLRGSGSIIIYITHFLDEVLEICDRICVLRDGEIASSGKRSDYTLNKIIKDMIGKELTVYDHCETSQCGELQLKIENVSSGEVLNNISMELNAGEVLGIWGLMGSGRTEFIRSVLGLYPITSGRIYVQREDKLQEIQPNRLLQEVGYVTETRHDDGLFIQKPVWWNISSGILTQIIEKPFNRINHSVERAAAKNAVETLNIVVPSIDAPMNNLSGGNQQKTVVAKWLQRAPRIFFLDEPTRGVDVDAKNEIQKTVRELSSNGASVLLVSSEIEEIINLSDRILVMKKGSIVKELSANEITKENLMAYSIGKEGSHVG